MTSKLKSFFAAALSTTTILTATAANTVQTVTQVSSAISITEAVDYHISSGTPFTATGSLNIANTDAAVVILDNVKPTNATAYLKYITINGEAAVNNSTCQIKIYNQGTIIMPYAKDIQPLTVYSGTDFTGTSTSNFGTENTGGFMNTLTDEKLNNRIRSFKLKRGYMVTFSTRAGGYGYSRCFVADTEDLEIAALPPILDSSISSYRIFKWNDAGKKGLANDTRATTNNMIGTTWCYSFGLGEDTGIDRECVPHHIYEGWPAIAECGNRRYATSTPTMKTNNEPGNSADDHPQTVAQVLAAWEQHMATGMRLCSPSSHDGSLGWMKEFMDSIDARGWRCDVVDVHSYWTIGQFDGLTDWYNRYKRPIWVSEWCWGASWNKNGAFNPGLTDEQAKVENAAAIQTICEKMNSMDFVERYAFWNSEADRSKIVLNGALTTAGKYYASMNSGVGYNKKYDYIPKLPKFYEIGRSLVVKYKDNTATLSWSERNGEYNGSMTVQRLYEGGTWQDIADITLQEQAATYTYTDTDAKQGCKYRIHLVLPDGKDSYSNVFTAVPGDVSPGDAYTLDGKTYYIGGNIVPNGDFAMGTAGWLSGTGQPLSAPEFEIVGQGGYNTNITNAGDRYLQAYSNGLKGTSGAVFTPFNVEPGCLYYASAAVCLDGVGINQVVLSHDGTSADSVAFAMQANKTWGVSSAVFNTHAYSKAIVSCYMMASKAQIDQIFIGRLFNTRQEAIADGVAQMRRRAEMVKAYNTVLPALNSFIDNELADADIDESDLENISSQLDYTILSVNSKAETDSIVAFSNAVLSFNLPTELADVLQFTLNTMDQNEPYSYYNRIWYLKDFFSGSWIDLKATDLVKNGNFSETAAGWNVTNGTYKLGQQAVSNLRGKSCWRAFWTGEDAAQGKQLNMGIRRYIDNLPHGAYLLECKATTDHYCATDQHSYIICRGDSISSPILTSGFNDLPGIADSLSWQTLYTKPVYVSDGESLTIGFTGSKDGATDNMWREYGNMKNQTGDNREGWWAATDFTLRRLPLYMRSVEGKWSTVCLPYAIRADEKIKLYHIAGLSPDLTKICLAQVSSSEPGMPCVVYSETPNHTFMEYGEPVQSPLTGPNSLRGVFVTSARAPKGSFILTDGTWQKVDGERPLLSDFTAIIYKESDLTVLEDIGHYTTMPINSVSGIRQVEADNDTRATLYTTDGKRAGRGAAGGVYIKTGKGKAVKVLK